MTAGATQTGTAGARPGKAARRAFIAFVVLALMVWVGIAVGANARAPGVVGIAAAIVGGMSAAVLTVAIGGWIALKLAEPAPVALASAPPANSDPAIAPALAALEAAQRPISRLMVERSAWRTPTLAAVAVAVWCFLVLIGASGGVFDFSIILLGAGLAGYGWSHQEAAIQLAEAYGQHGIATLAAAQGDLGWRKPSPVDLSRLRTEGVLPPSSAAISAGEIAGTWRGVSLRLAPIRTKPLPDQNTTFTGLLVEFDAPHLSAASMEDLVARYPRLAIRLSQLAATPGFGPPASAASGSRVSIAIPETARPRVFDPPSVAGAKAAAPRLARVRQVLSAVTGLADVLAEPAAAASQS